MPSPVNCGPVQPGESVKGSAREIPLLLREVNGGVIRGISEQAMQQRIVERMAGTLAFEPGDQRAARKRHVADRIEDLVAHELVRKTHQRRVDDRVAVYGERVVKRGAMPTIHLLQHVEFMHESDRAGRRDLAAKSVRGKRQRECLAADGGRREFDLEIVFEAIGRNQRGARILVRDLNTFENLDGTARCCLFAKAGSLQSER